tara:strand:- start:155 stop:481 length:327 start_codon:yes stop_codon:yes gene_type:complete
MKLTGKCKEDFDKWFEIEYSSCAIYDYWINEDLGISMQYGVYVDFFDSVGISVNNKRVDFNNQTWFCSIVNNNYIEIKNDLPINHFKTRTQARAAAIEKANEIYNNED